MDELIFRAVRNEDFQRVQELLKRGANVNATYVENVTPPPPPFVILDPRPELLTLIEKACLQGSLHMARLLMENGADIHVKDINGMTPFHKAILQESFEVARLLMENGADVNTKDKGGSTPLHNVCQGWGELEIAKFLIENGADVHAKNDGGNTPFDCIVFEYDKEMTKLMIDYGADFDTKSDTHGKRLFHDACVMGDLDLVNILLDSGADVHAKDNDGYSPLHLACNNNGSASPPNCSLTKNHLAVARLLIENGGADVNGKSNNDEATPLHDACKQGDLEVVQLLLSLGANAKARTTEGSTPLHLACSNHGSAPPEDWELVRNHLAVAELLIENGGAAVVNGKRNNGATPLHDACMHER